MSDYKCLWSLSSDS